MKQQSLSWSTFLLLVLVAFSVQGCLGIGGSGGQQIATSSSGQQVTVNQDVFKGKFYLTINGNLYVINGNNTSKELVNTGNVMDPAVAPDGKSVVFVEKFTEYSDLCVVSTAGGKVRVLLSGNQGTFFTNSAGSVENSYFWYAQPSWSQDGSTLLFLSDLQKYTWSPAVLGEDNALLDLQVFSIPFNDPSVAPTAVAYAAYGDGGDQNPSYRPGHSDQIVYTHYTYQPPADTNQDVQLFMEDPNAISAKPGVYYPSSPGNGFDPGIAITNTSSTISDPAFSPDGNSIAYIKTDTASNQMELDVMPVPPTTITQTPNDPTTEKQAVLAYEHHSSHLLTQTYISEPVWSPNGTQIAYIAYSGDTFNLWLSNVSHNAKTGQYSIQGNPVQITGGGDIDAASLPIWTN
jgi:Tol biopolymer transport system component